MLPKSYTGRAWGIAILILCAGFLLTAFNFLDRYWFARSGAVVTMLGIWTAFRRLTEVAGYNVAMVMAQAAARIKIHRRHPDDEAKRQELEKDADARINELIAKTQARVTYRYSLHEVFLLLVGTFVWGFGDLVRYVWEWGR